MMREDFGDCRDGLPLRGLYCVHQKPASCLVGGGGVLVAVVVVGVGVGVVVGVVVEVVMLVAVAVVGGGVVVGGNSCSHGAGAEANFMQTVCGEPRP